jgi:hypothetical protein
MSKLLAPTGSWLRREDLVYFSILITRMASTKQSSFLPFGFNRDSWQTLGQARRQARRDSQLGKVDDD